MNKHDSSYATEIDKLHLKSQKWIPILMLFLGFSVGVNAQCSVTVTNPLPSQIIVGNNCLGVLNWSPEPIFSVSGQGCSLTSVTLSTINSGPNPPVVNYTRGQMLPAGTTVFVTYQLNYMENGLPTTFNYNFTIFIIDDQDPVFTSPIPANTTVNCGTPAPVALNATDNCSGALVVNSVDNTSGYSLCGSGTIIRTWTATDASLNSVTATQHMTVMPDMTPPTFNIAMPADTTVACDGGFTPFVLTQGNVSDNCGAPVTILLTSANSGGFTCPAVRRTVYTWTITDACNNTNSHSQTVTFVDNTAPAIAPGGPNMATISCNNSTDPVVVIQNWAANNLTVNDNCDNTPTWTNNFTTLLNGCSSSTGTSTVTFTVSDGCNTSSRSIAFTVVDNTTPTITNPAQHLVVNCNTNYNTALTNWLTNFASATATDACSNNNTIARTYRLNNVVASIANIQNAFATSLNANACGSSVNIGGVPYTNIKGLVTVEFVFTDLCLNAASTMASFAVQDNSAPVFITPAGNQNMACTDIGTINTNFNSWLNNHGNAVASDACTSGNLTWYAAAAGTFNINTRIGTPPSLSNGCGGTGSATIDFYVEDVCGNITQVPTMATFSVTDINLPIWTVNPTNLTVECNGTANPGGQITTWLTANGNGTATDGCSGVTYSNNYTGLSNGCGATGTAVVIFTATDVCGNTATSTASVTIVDTNAPVWGVNPTDLSVVCNVSTPGVISSWLSTNGGGSATEACGTVTFTNNFSNTSGCAGTGSVVVTFTATDECGTTATRTATLTITDTTPPSWATNPSNLTIECDNNTNSDILINSWLDSHGNGTSTDDCSTISYSNNYNGLDYSCGVTGTAVVTFTATDECNNTSTRTAIISITDISPATIICPASILVNCSFAEQPAYTALAQFISAGGTASDNCSLNPSSFTLQSQIANNSVVIRTYAVSDYCNSPATCEHIIIIGENGNANAGDDQTICSGQSTSLTASGGTSYHWSNGLGNTATVSTPPLTSTITYTVTISNGSCTFTDQVTVNIVETPIATPQSNSPVAAGSTINLTGNFIADATYLWTGPNGFSSTLQNPSITNATVASSGIYTLVINLGTCSSTPVTINVIVNNGCQSLWYPDTDGDGYGAGNPVSACIQPINTSPNNLDCNNAIAAINPGATEICNGNIDDDCDGLADNADPNVIALVWYQDNDGDGKGNPNISLLSCLMPQGYVSNSLDCDDNSIAACPTPAMPVTSNVADVTAVFSWSGTTCAQNYSLEYKLKSSPAWNVILLDPWVVTYQASGLLPGLKYQWRIKTLCNTAGNVGSAYTTVQNFTTKYRVYPDNDFDGFGNSFSASILIPTFPVVGYSLNNLDCNDNSNAINPAASEICNNNLDDDCDGLTDGADPQTVVTTWYQDNDSDGKGNPAVSQTACSQPIGYVSNNLDCDDNNVAVCPMPVAPLTSTITDVTTTVSWSGTNCAQRYNLQYKRKVDVNWIYITLASNTLTYVFNNLLPGTKYQWRVSTVCDSVSNVVSSPIPVQNFTTRYRVYPDADGDGYGNSLSSAVFVATIPTPGYSSNNLDCNDNNSAAHPGGTEICNLADDNCNGITDEGIPVSTYYLDIDNDGYGNVAFTILACTVPGGYASNSADCNDTNYNIRPNAPEICNGGLDDDCDGLVDNLDPGVTGQSTWYIDSDGDGLGDFATTLLSCIPPLGYVGNSLDCNDNSSSPVCLAPSGLNVSGMTSNSASLSWANSPCVSNYAVQYRPNAAGSWLPASPVMVNGNSHLFTGLTPNTLYQYRIRALCNAINTNTPFITGTFTTLPLPMALADAGSTGAGFIDFELYPNPGDGIFNLRLESGNDGTATVMVLDGLGKLVMHSDWSLSKGLNVTQFDLSGMPNGVYQVQVRYREMVKSKKMVIVR
jgi:hypothetical protein